MDQIHSCANLCVRRALAFTCLGIVSAMTGLSFHPVGALRAGGILCALTAAVLALKGWRAPTRPYRGTELWLMLDSKPALPDTEAQRLFGRVLRDTYLAHADLMAAASLVLWVASILVHLAGVGAAPG